MLDSIITELRSTTKPSEKIDILRKEDNSFLRYLLHIAYEPFINTHLSIVKKQLPPPGELTLDDPNIQIKTAAVLNFCLESLSPKQNKEHVLQVFEKLTESSQELLMNTIIGNWKAGVSTKTINKAFPEFITVFEMQLSNKYADAEKKKKFERKPRLASFKLDGIRGGYYRDPVTGQWLARSRQGKQFLTVAHIVDDLEMKYQETGISFWDGEFHKDGVPFEEIQSMVTAFTRGSSCGVDFVVFIAGDAEGFLKQDSSKFKIVTEDMVTGCKYLKCLDQSLVEDADIPELLEKAFDLGMEGLMLRDPDNIYEFKRSDALLKLKKSKSDKSEEKKADCLIVDMEVGDYPIIVEGEDRQNYIKYIQLLTTLVVEQADGMLCRVGSGFDLDFRHHYTEHPEEVLGTVGEFMFQGYGARGRMRFPRLHRLRKDLTWEI